jgi:hypothetical protein
MKPMASEPLLRWVSAKELGLPTDYKKILECPPEKIERGHAALEQASNRKLADFYNGMGIGEMRSLKAKLFFVTAMLLEQAGAKDHRRDMVAQIQKLHRENPMYPSVATVYRTVAPLKKWLSQKGGMKHPPSVGELRLDPKPLLLLTEENLLDLAAQCKTGRKFAKEYRRRRGKTDTAPAPTESPKPAGGKSPTGKAVSILIQGKITAAMRRKIAAVLGDECQLLDLDGGRAATAQKWFVPDGSHRQEALSHRPTTH